MAVMVEIDADTGEWMAWLAQPGDVVEGVARSAVAFGLADLAAAAVAAAQRPSGSIPVLDRLALLREALEMERAAALIRLRLADGAPQVAKPATLELRLTR